MANGASTDYTLGQIKAQSENNEREIITIQDSMKEIVTKIGDHHDFIKKLEGGWRIIQIGGTVLGVLLSANMIVTIIF